jgi:hypothetical protein
MIGSIFMISIDSKERTNMEELEKMIIMMTLDLEIERKYNQLRILVGVSFANVKVVNK